MGRVKTLGNYIVVAVALSAALAIAEEYVEGEVLVKSADVLSVSYGGGVPQTGDEELDNLILELNVYEINEIYDFLPTEPVDDPNGKWTWQDWLNMMAEYRFDTYYNFLYENPDYTPPEAAEILGDCSIVDFAEPNGILELCYERLPEENDFIPNDVGFWRQWNFHNYGQNPPGGTPNIDIDAPEGWDYWPPPFRTAEVAVLDTGADLDHPDLAANLLPGRNFLNPGNPPEDLFGHGTHVSGIIAAVTNNTIGVAGVGYNKIKVRPCKISNYQHTNMKAAERAVLWAAQNGADVENFSWGGYTYSPSLHKAIQGAYELGVVMVGAIGNDTLWTNTHFPSCYKEVIGVSAINYYAELASYSNFGPDVECTAPGGEGPPDFLLEKGVMSTSINDDYAYKYGTSMAAPHVSAICALIQAHFPYAVYPPSARIAEVRSILYNSCIDQPPPGWYEYFGWGRVNLEKTMQNITGGFGLTANVANYAPEEFSLPTNNSAPGTWRLYQNYPNPARGNTTFAFDIPADAGVVVTALEVFDLAGRRVATVVNTSLNPGRHTYTWNLANSARVKTAPGVYIYRLRAGEQAFTRKLVITP